jgi:geranylgeranyl diphosphate synthase type II
MLGLTFEAALPAALALEMVHCFTLIHDDLPCMDDDDFRRGMPSNHKKFGESTALLAGDALMAQAIDTFMDSQVEPQRLLDGLRVLVWAMGPKGVIAGQAAESLLDSNSSLDDLESMHRLKTGALFSAALLIPKNFAGISDESSLGRALIQFADELGLAFQMADDLEDHEVSEATSILFYLSAEKASQRTIQKLQHASQALLEAWGPKAAGLKKIADEVILKIEKTQPR